MIDVHNFTLYVRMYHGVDFPSSDCVVFVTEPVFCSLANVLGDYENLPSPLPLCIKVCVCTCTCTCTCTCMYMCVYAYMSICTYAYVRVHVCVCVCVCITKW